MILIFCFLLQQTAIEIKDYVYNYCIQNENVTPNEIGEILNEILDEEFDTICEDNSVRGKLKCEKNPNKLFK